MITGRDVQEQVGHRVALHRREAADETKIDEPDAAVFED